MSKRILVTSMIVSLAVLLASLFAACGGPASPQVEEPTVVPTATPEKEEPTLVPTQTPEEEEPTVAPTPALEEEEPTVVPTATLEEEEPTAVPTATPQEEVPTEQPASIEGESLLQERCTDCHGLSRVTREQKTRDQWEQTVTRMVGKGAQLNAGEQATLIEYLAETYGP